MRETRFEQVQNTPFPHVCAALFSSRGATRFAAYSGCAAHRTSCTACASSGVGRAHSGNGLSAEYVASSFSFFDFCGESEAVAVAAAFESVVGDTERARFTPMVVK
jgi:hypothetical protein